MSSPAISTLFNDRRDALSPLLTLLVRPLRPRQLPLARIPSPRRRNLTAAREAYIRTVNLQTEKGKSSDALIGDAHSRDAGERTRREFPKYS